MPFHDDVRLLPAGDDLSFEIDDLRADIAQLEDELQAAEHDLEQVAEVLRALGTSLWGRGIHFDIDVVEVTGLELTENQAAVIERLLLL